MVKIKYEKEVHCCRECAFFIPSDEEYYPAYCRLLEEISELYGVEYIGDYHQYWECTPVLEVDPCEEVSPKCPFSDNFKYYTIESRTTHGVIKKYTIHDDKTSVEYYGKENLRKNGVIINEGVIVLSLKSYRDDGKFIENETDEELTIDEAIHVVQEGWRDMPMDYYSWDLEKRVLKIDEHE